MRPSHYLGRRALPACLALLAALMWGTSAGLAQEGEILTPTPSPSPTAAEPTQPLPTSTATPTLEALAPGTGRVAVEEIALRSGPGIEFPIITALFYGDQVRPLAIDIGRAWMVVDAGRASGWLAANLVTWAPDVDFGAVPLFESFDELGLLEPEPLEDSATPTRTAPSPTATASEAAEEAAPAPATATSTAAAAAEVPAAQAPSPVPTDPPPPTDQPPTAEAALPAVPPVSPVVWGAAGAALVFGLAIFGLSSLSRQNAAFKQELTRYARGFPLSDCPVCRVGELELEEKMQRSFGASRMSPRLVRCSVCRSVLREIEPGTWRYNIDPLANPGLAERFSGQQFTDADLLMLVQEASHYPSTVEAERPPMVEAYDITDLLPEIEPVISAIEAAQEEERRRQAAPPTGADPSPAE